MFLCCFIYLSFQARGRDGERPAKTMYLFYIHLYIYLCIYLLRREIETALSDRDRALKESHELREKVGDREKSTGKATLDFDSRYEFYVYLSTYVYIFIFIYLSNEKSTGKAKLDSRYDVHPCIVFKWLHRYGYMNRVTSIYSNIYTSQTIS